LQDQDRAPSPVSIPDKGDPNLPNLPMTKVENQRQSSKNMSRGISEPGDAEVASLATLSAKHLLSKLERKRELRSPHSSRSSTGCSSCASSLDSYESSPSLGDVDVPHESIIPVPTFGADAGYKLMTFPPGLDHQTPSAVQKDAPCSSSPLLLQCLPPGLTLGPAPPRGGLSLGPAPPRPLQTAPVGNCSDILCAVESWQHSANVQEDTVGKTKSDGSDVSQIMTKSYDLRNQRCRPPKWRRPRGKQLAAMVLNASNEEEQEEAEARLMRETENDPILYVYVMNTIQAARIQEKTAP